MKKITRILSLILVAVMVLGCFNGIVIAEASGGRKWFSLTGGSNNAGGHNYSSGSGPLFYLDGDKTMVSGGTISLALKPNNNWGVFYSYIDDSNWLYVGWDPSSNWYYQYRWNGQENWPQIAGLPDPVDGEELSLTISLSNETLAVTVNGTTAYATNQTLKDMANANTTAYDNLGRFGVMAKGANAKIEFADFTYDGVDCMSDNWRWCCERDGQTVQTIETAMAPVSGTVTDDEGNPVAGATVRVGNYATETDEAGKYAFEGIQIGEYSFSVSKPGYQAYSTTITVENIEMNEVDAVLEPKAGLDLTQYDTIESDTMTVYVGKEFPLVARYVMKSDESGKTFFRGNETALNEIVINGTAIEAAVMNTVIDSNVKTYDLHVEGGNVNLDMTVAITVEGRNLTWQVTELQKNEGCARIATIDIPHLNILTVDASEEESVFAGAQLSTTTTAKADTYITFDNGFVPSNEDGYLYAFLTNGKLSAGIDSNSEREGDKRVERINGADTISLTSAVWYYESGDSTGQASASYYEYQASELPCIKVAIAESDLNGDGEMDWNDGAIAFRDVMHYAYGYEGIKDMVNYRIVMNFESAAPNPFLVTADNVKKVYLATDGLPQALLLKGYGNEGHDSANSEYADVGERLGGIEDFQKLLEIAHDYNTEVGIHVNAQEAYPEARSFNETMISNASGNRNGNGWGWLDQSVVINKLWDLSSDARLKRFVQLYDRINDTDFLSLDWDKKEYVKDSQGFFLNADGEKVTREEILEIVKADAATHEDNMDFIYLDVWYQDAWETRRIAEEINSLGWRFSTEFSGEGEYDSTWQHWSTDTTYGGAGAKGLNSDIIRFLRNDQRDSQVLNWPAFGGTADNPLLGGFRLYGFEGWGGQQDFNQYIEGTFNENVPTKFLQHYQVIDWENYADGESPVGNTEKKITLKNGDDIVVVTRNEEQRSDIEIERVITLNGKVVLNTDINESTYLLPWTDNQDGTEKLYHWNLDGGETTWELQDDWAALENVYVYKLTDQGRVEEQIVAVEDGTITLTAEASVAYVVVKGEQAKKTVVFGDKDYVADPGFNGYADGAKLNGDIWTGDIDAEGVSVFVTNLGDQKLLLNNTESNVAVSTTISGLTKDENYVAEVYIANESDAKAALTVNAGTKESTSYTYRSIVRNTVSCDSEHGTNMQRMLVTFVAESDTATLTLSREAGAGYTTIDDIRVVKKTLNNYKEDGSFEQDFESVVQGLYPFVLTYNAGGDSRTHLAQDNGEFTSQGWNGKAVDDVIGGEWALKHHTSVNGIVYQTIPQNFRFEPGKAYQVEFDYQTVSGGYQMVVGDGKTYTAPTEYLPTTGTAATKEERTGHATMEVVGSGSGQTWIGLYMNSGLCYSDTATGTVDFILDNLKITELKGAEVVSVSKTDLLLGETATVYGSSLDTISWTASENGIVTVSEDNNSIKAVGIGTAILTATFPSGKTVEFTFTVEDAIVNDIPRSEYPDVSAEANTDAIGSETAPNGDPNAAVDGNSSTFWHSSWAGGVSSSNPAVITVDLGTTLTIGGFEFQQRPSANNGIVQVYSYRILDENNNVLASGESIEVPGANRTGGAWTTQKLAENVDARYIEISVLQGQGGFAAIAEIEPISVTKTALEECDDHVPGAAMKENEVPATCTEGGSYDSVVYCAECGEKLSSEFVSVGATGHSFGDWIVTDEPTCTDEGEETRSCSCGETEYNEIDPLGHDYENGICGRCDATLDSFFEDVFAGDFFFDSVEWAVAEGITTGATETTYDPEGDLLRAQFVTMLWRNAGSPKAENAENPFTDVTEEDFFYDAVLWAVEKGITNGISKTEFGAYQVTNRAQAVTFLWRYMNQPASTESNDFTDVEAGEWYEAPINWAVEMGVTNGMGDGTFGVENPCNRAHAVTFMYRALAE